MYWNGPAKTGSQEGTRVSTGSLELIDQLFVVLARLRLGLFTQDISDSVGVSIGVFSNILDFSLTEELKILNSFQSREVVNFTMPRIFHKEYPSVRVILDCYDIFVPRGSLVNQIVTFSNYKHRATVKFLMVQLHQV